jgi:TolB-like protein
MIMRKLLLYGCITLEVLILAACGSKSVSHSFVREDVDFTFIERIAVLPFANNSSDKYAPERARDVTITQVLQLGLFDTVEKVLVDNVMYEEGVDSEGPIDPLTLKRMGQRLNTQAVILGTVDLAESGRIGASSYPVMALTLRLIEVNSGLILWQASGNFSGDSWSRRLFGLKPDDTYQIASKLVRRMLRTAPAGYL